MNSFWECFVFTLIFVPLRSYAGGYHAETRLRCFIQSMLTLALALGTIKILTIYRILFIPLSLIAAALSVVIWRLSPVDTENKRLNKEERGIFRKKARITLIIEIIAAVVTYIVGFSAISQAVVLALIVAGSLVTTEYVKNKKLKKQELVNE